MRKAISLLMAILMTLSLIVVSTASDIESYAVYAKNGIRMLGSVSVKGDVILNSGKLDYPDWASFITEGSIYFNAGASFLTNPGPYSLVKREYIDKGKVINSAAVKVPEFAFEEVEFPKDIAYSLDTLNVDSQYAKKSHYVLDKDAYIKNLNITADGIIDIKVPAGVIRKVRIDNFTTTSGKINILGDGSLILYVKDMSISGWLALNESGDASKCLIYLGGDSVNALNLNNFGARADIYSPSTRSITLGGSQIVGQYNKDDINVYGNIYLGGNLSIASSIGLVGNLYAPATAVNLSGSSAIYGLVYSNTLSMNGSAKIVGNGTLNYNTGLMDELLKVEEPTPTPTPTPTPVDDGIPAGEIVEINFPYAYLYGYASGSAGADTNIRRQEAAALIYRLLKQDDQLGDFVRPTKQSFSDLSSADWSYSALEYMNYIGVYNGGKINPMQNITRGEVAKIVAFSFRIHPTNQEVNFSDLDESNPNYLYVKALVNAGLYVGYGDDSIKPDANITRAEFITMINRIIGRDSQYNIDGVKNPYPDLEKNHWAYNEMMRASFGFSDEKVDGYYNVDPSRKPDRSTIDYN